MLSINTADILVDLRNKATPSEVGLSILNRKYTPVYFYKSITGFKKYNRVLFIICTPKKEKSRSLIFMKVIIRYR